MEEDPIIRMLHSTGVTPTSALEIGASNGYRLEHLRTSFNCRVKGVEPSREAIVDGQSRHPEVSLVEGVASELPLGDECVYDLVIINFVLHWVDRSTLLRSVAELDRVLTDGGYLVIGDFYPPVPQRVEYHHLPGQNVWTYKQSYMDILLASNLYELVAFLPFAHAIPRIDAQAPAAERAGVAMLKKTLQGRYATIPYSGGTESSGK